MAYGYIYKINNLVNGKLYVGQTVYDINKRFREHKHSSITKTTYLYNAMRKYGIDNFTIEEIDTADSLDDLNNKEIEWIKKLNTKIPNGYNIVDGGNGIKGFHHTKETKEILRNKSKGNTNALGKHKVSKVGRENMILAHKGKESNFKNKTHTLEARNKLSTNHSKKVICLETQEIYPSSIIASKILKIPNHIGNCCNGQRKSCGGYHWEWA